MCFVDVEASFEEGGFMEVECFLLSQEVRGNENSRWHDATTLLDDFHTQLGDDWPNSRFLHFCYSIRSISESAGGVNPNIVLVLGGMLVNPALTSPSCSEISPITWKWALKGDGKW
jgi:hypothetical protein